MKLSPLQVARYQYSPKLPGMLRNGISDICVCSGGATESVADQEKIKELFPKAVNAAVQEALKRQPPKDGAGAKPSQSFASKFASDYSNRMNGGKKDGAQ